MWHDISAGAPAVAVLVAAVALFYTRRSANTARLQRRLAEEQTQLQRQVQKDASQPYVWADIRPDEGSGWLLKLILANEGPTVATDVKVTFDPPLQTNRKPESLRETSRKLQEGIKSLPPGRRMSWTLDAAPAYFESGDPLVYAVRIDAHGPSGPIKTLEYVISLEDIRQSSVTPSPLYELTQAVKDVTKQLAKRNKS